MSGHVVESFEGRWESVIGVLFMLQFAKTEFKASGWSSMRGKYQDITYAAGRIYTDS